MALALFKYLDCSSITDHYHLKYSTEQYSTVKYSAVIGAEIYLNKAEPLEKANIQV